MNLSKKNFEASSRKLAKRLIDYSLKKGKTVGITDVSVVVSMSDDQENVVEKNTVVGVETGVTQVIWVKLFAGDRVLSFSQNNLDPKHLEKIIDKQLKVIHLIPEDTDKRLLEKEKVYKGKAIDLDIYDSNQPNQEQLVDYAKKMETAAMDVDGVKTAREISVSRGAKYSFTMATNGVEKSSQLTSAKASISAIAEDKNNGEMEIAYDFSYARHFSDMAAPEELGKSAGKKAVSKLSSVQPKTGKVPVVFAPEASTALFSAFFQAIDGGNVYRGTTFLKGKVGKKVLSKDVTIVDNPRVKRGISAGFVDSSGVESKEITFVKNGFLKTYNVSLREARQIGMEPIGRNNGRTNTTVLPGNKTVDTLVEDIKEGIYVVGFQGGKVDVNTKQFSKPAHGFLIKDGKITSQAVSGFVVAGDLEEMFKDITLADDTPNHPNTKTTMAIPTSRINKLTIAGS